MGVYIIINIKNLINSFLVSRMIVVISCIFPCLSFDLSLVAETNMGMTFDQKKNKF